MRSALSILLLGALALCGCAGRTTPGSPAGGAKRADGGAIWASPAGTNQSLIVTPEQTLVGKVTLVNATARHVVLNFPLGRMPAVEQRLDLYRGGLKVGEVKTTTFRRDNNVVADMVAGEAAVGDEARGQ